MKKDILIILIPVLFILVLVIIKSLDKNSFELDAETVHKLSLNKKYILTINDYKNSRRTSKVLHQLVDIRNVEDFEVNHIKGAINVPLEDLLKSNIFEPDHIVTKYILYSESMGKSMKAWTLLTQKGYKNIYVLDIPNEFISQKLFESDSVPAANEKLKYTFQPDTTTRLN